MAQRVLICLNASYLPQTFGGAQTATHDLARTLMDQSVDVRLACELSGIGSGGLSGKVLLKLGFQAIRDKRFGYQTFRSWHLQSAVEQAIKNWKPTFAIVQSMVGVPIAKFLTDSAVPTVFYFHNAEHQDLGGNLEKLPCSFLANSEFTKKDVWVRFGVDSQVMAPFTHSDVAGHIEGRGDSVLFINPCERKGLGVALNLVKSCTDIPFIFVKAWGVDEDEARRLEEAAAQFKNLTILDPVIDVGVIYRRARVVLVPSQWVEAWGRVASEAHERGIPVLASDSGGLPESVGPGGILLPPNAPSAAWEAALRSLWNDASVYEKLSIAAKSYSRRDELRASNQQATLTRAAIQAESLMSSSSNA